MAKYIRLFLVCMLLANQPVMASAEKVSLSLKNVNLSEAIRLLAKFLQVNVIISPVVQGEATVQLIEADPQAVWDILLATHNLGATRFGSVLYVAPEEELLRYQQEEIKRRDVSIESSALVTRFWQIKYGKAEDISHLIQDDHATLMSKRGKVRVDARTNTLFIQDVAVRMEELNRLIQKLDVPVRQLRIAARLASVDSDYERELGIHYAVNPPSGLVKTVQQEAGQYSLGVMNLSDGSQLDIKLSALENDGHAELISSPSLFTSNQQPASIEAGEEVPYQEVSNSGGTAVAFKKAVLGLKVTPQILPNNKVLLQLQINQDRPSSKMVLGVPTISTRQIVTSVLVKAGQTIVLGGIFENNLENGQQGLPFLGKIPLVGWLFKQQKVKRSKRELLIFVTPTIVTQET